MIVTGAGRRLRALDRRGLRARGRKRCASPTCGADALEALAAELKLDPAHTILHATDLTRGRLDRRSGRPSWRAPGARPTSSSTMPASIRSGLLDMPAAEWDRIFDVNLRAPFLCPARWRSLMIAAGRRGSIVNISSGAARQMRNGPVPYCTSKTALERLTKGFALELAPYRIRVNAVEPGFAPGSVGEPAAGRIRRANEGTNSRWRARAARRIRPRRSSTSARRAPLHHRRGSRRRRRQFHRHLRARPTRARDQGRLMRNDLLTVENLTVTIGNVPVVDGVGVHGGPPGGAGAGR